MCAGEELISRLETSRLLTRVVEGSGFFGLPLCCFSDLSGQESERSFLNALYRN